MDKCIPQYKLYDKCYAKYFPREYPEECEDELSQLNVCLKKEYCIFDPTEECYQEFDRKAAEHVEKFRNMPFDWDVTSDEIEKYRKCIRLTQMAKRCYRQKWNRTLKYRERCKNVRDDALMCMGDAFVPNESKRFIKCVELSKTKPVTCMIEEKILIEALNKKNVRVDF